MEKPTQLPQPPLDGFTGPDAILPDYITAELSPQAKGILAAQYWMFRGYTASEIKAMLMRYLGVATESRANKLIEKARLKSVNDAMQANSTKRMALEGMAMMVLRDSLENKAHSAAVNALKQLMLINNVGNLEAVAPVPTSEFIDEDLVKLKEEE